MVLIEDDAVLLLSSDRIDAVWCGFPDAGSFASDRIDAVMYGCPDAGRYGGERCLRCSILWLSLSWLVKQLFFDPFFVSLF